MNFASSLRALRANELFVALASSLRILIRQAGSYPTFFAPHRQFQAANFSTFFSLLGLTTDY